MKEKSFNGFIKNRGSAQVKAMMAEAPAVQSWGEVRMYVRRDGAQDHEVVKIRAAGLEFKKSK